MTSFALEVYDTEQREARCRRFTTSRAKAEAWERIPRIDFTDSGHGLVFMAREGVRKTKKCPEIAPHAYADHERRQALVERLADGRDKPHVKTADCEKALLHIGGRPSLYGGHLQEGEKRVCSCGRVFVRVIEESEGAWWEPLDGAAG